MSKRVAVIGGNGFLGTRTVRALESAGLEVVSFSRSSSPPLDLGRPDTFSVLDDFALVVDLSNGTRASLLALARYCLGRETILLEATSDSAALEKLIAAIHQNQGPGSVVLGAGIFTGLSNLLARSVTSDGKETDKLQLSISASPFSGAGKGTIDLMAAGMSRRPRSVENGLIQSHKRTERGPLVAFADGTFPTLRTSFAEQILLPLSIRAKQIEVFFGPRPGFLVTAFVLTPRWLARTWLFGWYMRVYFTFLRRFLLRGRVTRVEMVAHAESGEEISEKKLSTADGMVAGAAAIAAMVEEILAKKIPGGLSCVDDVCVLDAVVTRANQLGGEISIR